MIGAAEIGIGDTFFFFFCFFPPEPLHCLQSCRTLLISHTEGRFVSLPPSKIHLEYLWQIRNRCRIYLISLVDCCRRHLSSIHLAIISLSSPSGYCGWKKSPVLKSLSVLFKVVVSLGFVSCPILEMWFLLYSTTPCWTVHTVQRGTEVPGLELRQEVL